MINKVLTISIAAYNVEKYIDKCLHSLCDVDDIEVLVIDDGSNDNTYNIAKMYQDKFPNVFRVIHKENGGYGSTVNYSIKNANGKYFKLLDGDDWFNNDELNRFIKYLKTSDVDCIFTKFNKVFYKDNDIVKVVAGINYKCFDKEICINGLDIDEGIPMHCITYKTKILKDMNLRLPEHILYTDNIYASLPFTKVNNVIFKNFVVYNYRLGLNEQSVNVNSLIKHADDSKTISIELTKSYKGENKYLLTRIAATCVDYFVILSKIKNSNSKIKEFDSEIRDISVDIYDRMVTLDRKASKMLKFKRFTKYII